MSANGHSDPYRHLEVRGGVVDIEDDPDFEFIDAMAQKCLGAERYYSGHRPGDVRVAVHVEQRHTTNTTKIP